eukprot:TRINITY_DN34064_c0_g1_i1.p1 TRINITY_DN34064_c0_g1~~TRINITY_DN34064_c0_g1_i1.p1  ORF type:complete len:1651 (+),score=328.54 TRINITY_DN34064_c0_g1_i1:184-4953(+)
MEELSICPDAPQCPEGEADECIPQDCNWGEWRDWENDGVSGVCHRSRTFSPNRCGGEACVGTSVETMYCEPKVHPPQPCEFATWSAWTPCDPKTLQRWRTRSVVKGPAYGGAPCEGSLSETEPCGDRSAPVSCQLGDWMEWSGCSRKCGGGQQMRVRSIAQEASDGGELCKGEDGRPLELQTTQACNVDIPCENGPAAQDCMLTDWGDWSNCDLDDPSKAFQRLRTRSIAMPSASGGAACEASLQETRSCEASEDLLPPKDCRFSQWSAWKLCDKTCEGGQTYRTRTVEEEGEAGGRACQNSLLETKPCNEVPCSVNTDGADCQLSQWTYWGECSTTCGEGIRKRAREVLTPPLEGGLGCSAITEEIMGCLDNEPCDSQDCEWGSWTKWSDCSKKCDGGQRSRHRSVFVPPSGGGQHCQALESVNEIESCGTEPCSTFSCKDGVWEDWAAWGHCSRACGGGSMWRHRKIASEASSCGTPAVGVATEEMSCNGYDCLDDRDCSFGSWSQWSECSASCEGQQKRLRNIDVPGSGSGRSCEGPLQELRPCNGPEDNRFGKKAEACGFAEKQNCELGSWTAWSMCSKRCGGGTQQRKREILRQARMGGEPCADHMEEVQHCSTMPCGEVMDCLWGDWAGWGKCTKCDGEKVRVREVQHLGNDKGKPCAALDSREVAQCNNCPAQKTYWCVWQDWAEGVCSATCGTGGKLRRERSLMKTEVPPEKPSDALGNITGEHEFCQGQQVSFGECKDIPKECTQCVPKNCSIGDWTDWDEPTTCNGLCVRHRKVNELNNECGAPCSATLRDTKTCLIPECKGTQDCQFSHWSSWTGCEAGSTGRQELRVREMAVQTGPLGKPCAGPQKETRPCDVKEDVVNCKLSTWSQWGNCSKVCGGGQQDRFRTVVDKAAKGGLPCNGSMRMTRACGKETCGEDEEATNQDCELADWTDWEGCEKGSVQAFRTRSPKQEAKGKGLPCAGIVREAGHCPKVNGADCVFSDWAQWGQCGATCGGGQRFRTREIVVENQPGGKPCKGPIHETETCGQEIICNVQEDCQVSHWSLWSDCSVSCGQGQHVRQRMIVQAAKPDGIGCNLALLEVGGCVGAKTSSTCGDDVDCKWGQWGVWSGCQKAEHCGLGFRSRNRKIAVAPRGRGETCDPLPTMEVKPDVVCAKSCTHTDECVDGEWSTWSSWGKCSITCGRGGSRKRMRDEKVKANECGIPALGDKEQFEPCDAEAACESELGAQDCKFGDWTEWQQCTAECNGAQKRSRAIVQYSAYGGAACVGPVTESQRCNPSPTDHHPPMGCRSGAPVDCQLEPFGDWSDCSATCGTGFQTRSRHASVQPAFGGKDCENPLEELRECNATQACEILTRDCELGDWREWGVCDPFTAQRARERSVVVPQAGFGKACRGNMSETATCQRICQDKTYICGWGDWKDWGSCSSSCGASGRRKRARALVLTEASDDRAAAAVEPAAGDASSSAEKAPSQEEPRSSTHVERPPAPSEKQALVMADVSEVQSEYETLRRRLELSSGSHKTEMAGAFAAGLLGLAAVAGLVQLVIVPAASVLRRHSSHAPLPEEPLVGQQLQVASGDLELQT